MDLGSLVRRLVPGAGPSRTGARSTPAGADASGGALSSSVPLAAGEWRSLPPIQRAVGDAPLIAPSAPFRAGLATAGPAPIALAPLGHERHLEAPAGIATGIATPVQRAPAEPVPASVRRREGAHRGPGTPTPVVMRWPDTHADEPPADAPDVSAAAEAEAGVPVLPGSIEGLSLVTAPAAAPRPIGLVGWAAVAGSFHVAQRSAASPISAGGDPVGPAGGSVPPVAAGEPPGPAAGPAGPIAGTGPPMVARRVRLGPPVRSPASAGPVGTPTATPGPPAVARSVAATHAVAPEGGAAGVSASGATGEAPTAPPVLAPRGPATTEAIKPGAAGPPIAVDREIAETAVQPPVVLRTAGPARRPSLPLVGGLRPSASPGSPAVVPRPAASVPPTGGGGEPGSPSAALAALARVDPFGGPFAGPGSASLPSGETAWSVPLADGPAGPGSAARPAAGAGFSVMPAVSRSVDGEDDSPADAEPRLAWTNPWRPGGTSAADPATSIAPGGAGPSLQTQGAGRGAALPVASRAPSGPFLPRPRGLRVAPAIQRRFTEAANRSMDAPVEPAAALEPFAGREAGPDLPPVSRLADGIGPPVTLAPVQRADDATGAAGGAGTAGATGAAGGAAGAPGSPTAEKELDDLARRLYDRIGLRLRRDLLVERERAGALVDRGF